MGPSSSDSLFLSSPSASLLFLDVNSPFLVVVGAHPHTRFANVLADLCVVGVSALLPDSRRVRRQNLERLTADSFPPTHESGRSCPAVTSSEVMTRWPVSSYCASASRR